MNSDAASVPFLQVVGVHKRFTGVHALRGVSLSFQRGQIYHLLGENGCGKSGLHGKSPLLFRSRDRYASAAPECLR